MNKIYKHINCRAEFAYYGESFHEYSGGVKQPPLLYFNASDIPVIYWNIATKFVNLVEVLFSARFAHRSDFMSYISVMQHSLILLTCHAVCL